MHGPFSLRTRELGGAGLDEARSVAVHSQVRDPVADPEVQLDVAQARGVDAEVGRVPEHGAIGGALVLQARSGVDVGAGRGAGACVARAGSRRCVRERGGDIEARTRRRRGGLGGSARGWAACVASVPEMRPAVALQRRPARGVPRGR